MFSIFKNIFTVVCFAITLILILESGRIIKGLRPQQKRSPRASEENNACSGRHQEVEEHETRLGGELEGGVDGGLCRDDDEVWLS